MATVAEIIMAVATVEEIIMAVATAVGIRNLIILIPINPLEQKVGKIEVLETLLKTLNMKVVEAGEKEEFQIRVIHHMRTINNPFLQV